MSRYVGRASRGRSSSTLAVLTTTSTANLAETLSVVDALSHSGSIEVVDAVLVSNHAGTLQFSAALEPGCGEMRFAAWRWFLDGVVGAPAGGSRPAARASAACGLGESLFIELREVLTGSAAWLAMVASRLDAAAAVAALRRVPATRLVYGPLHDRVLDELLRWKISEAVVAGIGTGVPLARGAQPA